ncbi:hypothetical protein [Ornithinimicrobium avium]|uniref:Glycosyltransferase RgtA/B/C/D-like domain-containing protein n=1 Tax=Ornithinimicrobium avium TaxID=2283195 RepID=A0A345NPB1_9MICO|nr:hypothetical protein [Ornithinimicrobium avium]AXH96869.1 hypothetical protein DV701_12760 [Ornithinimicrobium avium]
MTQPTNALTFAVLTVALAAAALLVLACTFYRGPFGVKVAAVASFVLHGGLGISNVLWSWFAIADQETYHAQALALADGRNPPIWQESKQAWPVLLSWMYRWIEPNLQLGIVANALLTGITVLLVHRTAATLHPRAGGYAVLLLFLMPSWWIWGSFAVREGLVWTICAGIALCLVHLRRGSIVASVGFLALCGLLVAARGTLVLLILAGLAPVLLIGSANKLRGALLGLGVVAGALFFFNAVLAETVERSDDLELIRNDQSRAESGFVTGQVLVTLARVLGGPFPWEVPSLGLIFLPFGAFAIGILVLTLIGLRRLGLPGLWLAGPAGSILLGLALVSGNYGTMMRLRDMATILVLPLAARGLLSIVRSPFWRDRSIQGRPTVHRTPGAATTRVRDA